MKITLNQPKEVTVVPERKQLINEIEIIQMIDIPTQKIVRVITNTLGQITLWEGAAYDAAGQWTDQDVINRIKEIYSIL